MNGSRLVLRCWDAARVRLFLLRLWLEGNLKLISWSIVAVPVKGTNPRGASQLSALTIIYNPGVPGRRLPVQCAILISINNCCCIAISGYWAQHTGTCTYPTMALRMNSTVSTWWAIDSEIHRISKLVHCLMEYSPNTHVWQFISSLRYRGPR